MLSSLTEEICFLFIMLILGSVFNYKLNFNDRIKYIKFQDCKLNLIKSNDILENLNSGLISFGEDMHLNYNKKFSHIFTSLVNEVARNQNTHKNTISFLKSLNLDCHLDGKIKNFQTAKLFNKKTCLNKTKSYSIFKLNTATFTMNKLRLCENINKTKIQIKTKINISEESSIHQIINEDYYSDLILLLIFFNKESIKFNCNLDVNIR